MRKVEYWIDSCDECQFYTYEGGNDYDSSCHYDEDARYFNLEDNNGDGWFPLWCKLEKESK